MAGKCCLCGREFNFISAEFPISESELPGKKICDDCNRLLNNLKIPAKMDDKENFPIYKERLQKYLDRVTDYSVGEFCNKLLIKADYQWRLLADLDDRIRNHLLITTADVKNYKIVKYNGIVIGEEVLYPDVINDYPKRLKAARVSAFNKMIQESVRLGGNAIIGVDLKYTPFTPSIFAAVASGTSVILEEDRE
ncbi:heavy metal-binding domain-containing protein [Clostridium sp. MCC353]|uniref:YbjQ family protein n=1 Tax=Clostridium sp. MCC353 TaxID=2592646 RepID=UPI001C016968|nr:heavy metal-binding domain-containing protein [Clostridium sp. MCC353]